LVKEEFYQERLRVYSYVLTLDVDWETVWYVARCLAGERRRRRTIQVLMDPKGLSLWVSDVLPGSAHDLTAARELALAIA